MMGSWEALRSGYIARARVQAGRAKDCEDWLGKQGFEQVDAEPGSVLTKDGREVLWAGQAAYALRPDVHNERLSAAFKDEKKQNERPAATKSVAGTESLSVMVCPKCGDAMQHTKVCPACAAGKLGYRHRYTCACGEADVISKDKL